MYSSRRNFQLLVFRCQQPIGGLDLGESSRHCHGRPPGKLLAHVDLLGLDLQLFQVLHVLRLFFLQQHQFQAFNVPRTNTFFGQN
ncbi:hypothetical protein L596_027459 [Steinernema carpocapsae]|uniref:Uncharacterized protein n=1 Tax=Steinernema carpocapsae TaxID=34508 RepID=A0A4U5LVG6_STECR|nr:hypothetical protein L596_027459 [Steinernema carpocapsae]